MKYLISLLCLISFLLFAGDSKYELVDVLPQQERFERPLAFVQNPLHKDYYYLLEQRGRIFGFERLSSDRELILDWSKHVGKANEEGMLSFVFHPNFSVSKPYVYIYYSAKKPRRSVVARLSLKGKRIVMDSKKILLEIPEPYGNHNGGQLAFGPEGYLYIGVGDGGSAHDPHGNGQNMATLHGAILRIDVDKESQGKPYSIPVDNPFVAKEGARAEIWAYGLRNPWRFSFDKKGRLFCADVGQNKFEEVNIVTKGANCGWKVREGLEAFVNPKTKEEFPQDGAMKFLEPVFSYPRDKGISITGGFVYEGSLIPELKGAYICADYVYSRYWAIFLNEDDTLREARELGILASSPGSFLIDESGEIHVCSYQTGKVMRLQKKK